MDVHIVSCLKIFTLTNQLIQYVKFVPIYNILNGSLSKMINFI